MSMRLTCECGRTLGYEHRHIGQKVRCAGCSKILTVPEPGTDSEEPRTAPDRETLAMKPLEDERPSRYPAPPRRPRDDDDPDDRPARRRDEEDLDERPRRRRDEEDLDDRPRRRPVLSDEEEEPRPRSRRRRREEEGGPGFMERMGDLFSQGPAVIVILILAIGGGILCFYAYQQGVLASQASETPQTMTIKELIDKGPGNNAHVIITDFEAADNYVFTFKTSKYDTAKDPTGKSWESVYVPLVPRSQVQPGQGGPAGQPGQPGLPGQPGQPNPGGGFAPKISAGSVRVLMLSKKVRNLEELKPLVLGRTSMQGTIINSISSIDSQAETLLKQTYPGTDFSKVYILEEGRKPSSKTGNLVLMLIGIGGIVLGLSAGLIALIFKPKD